MAGNQDGQGGAPAWSGETPTIGFSRRAFIEQLAHLGGISLAVTGMEALGFSFASAQSAPPALTKGKGARVIVLGAGLAGLTAAYELTKMGYEVQVLEAHDRAGGRSQTARKGSINIEVTGTKQVCGFDEDLYFNTGPWRIPYHHSSTLYYVREFGVPLEILVNDNDAAYVFSKNGQGPLAGKRLRKGELTMDMRGYEAELLAKCARQGALDSALTTDDRDRFIQYLIQDGSLQSKDLSYDGSSDQGLHAHPGRRSYLVKPGAGINPGPGVPSEPYTLTDILSSNAWKSLTNAATYEHPTTMFQPTGGMDMIVKGFERQVGRYIKYSAVVQNICQ